MATDWPAIRVEYVSSSKTYGEIAAAHGLKEGTVRQRGNRENWLAERNAVSQTVTEAAAAQIADTRLETLVRFNADDLRMARAIRAKAASMLGDAASASDLRALAGAVDVAQKIGRLALGATTENTNVTSTPLPVCIDEFV